VGRFIRRHGSPLFSSSEENPVSRKGSKHLFQQPKHTNKQRPGSFAAPATAPLPLSRSRSSCALCSAERHQDVTATHTATFVCRVCRAHRTETSERYVTNSSTSSAAPASCTPPRTSCALCNAERYQDVTATHTATFVCRVCREHRT
jgi:hypothetical protein